MEEESAIDVIFELREMIKAQGEQISLLQQNLSMINSKVNGALFPTFSGKDVPRAKPMDIPSIQKVESTAPIVQETVSQPANTGPRQNSRVFGKLQDYEGKNIPDVDVTVMDANNKVIKRTKSNRSGEWNSFLPPGKYSVEFSKNGMQSDFRTFDVRAGQREVEVT